MEQRFKEMPRKRILIIDDEEDMRSVVAMALQMDDYEVIEAVNGLDGLAAARMNHPDLVVCDIMMPKIDGMEFLKLMREEEGCTDLPFIFLTGKAASDDVRKGMCAGADDYLMKPFVAAELLAVVKAQLEKWERRKRYHDGRYNGVRTSIVHSLPHEFRTPLNVILGYAQMLRDDESVTGREMKEFSSRIHAAGQRLLHVLESFTMFSRLRIFSEDRGRMHSDRLNANTGTESILQEVVLRCMEKNGRIGSVTLDVVESAVKISGEHLRHLFAEVLDNALKFSEVGTPVRVSAGPEHTSYCITVEDHGRGMSAEQIRDISLFNQFDRQYFEQQGLGIGLPLAILIAEYYGGTLEIRPREDHGTIVDIRLPLKKMS